MRQESDLDPFEHHWRESILTYFSLHYYRGQILAAQDSLPEALREINLSMHIRKKVLGDHIQTAASC